MDARNNAASETLKDDTVVTLRAIPSRRRWRHPPSFRGLDRELVYRRFSARRKALSPAELEQLTGVDLNRAVAR